MSSFTPILRRRKHLRSKRSNDINFFYLLFFQVIEWYLVPDEEEFEYVEDNYLSSGFGQYYHGGGGGGGNGNPYRREAGKREMERLDPANMSPLLSLSRDNTTLTFEPFPAEEFDPEIHGENRFLCKVVSEEIGAIVSVPVKVEAGKEHKLRYSVYFCVLVLKGAYYFLETWESITKLLLHVLDAI